MPPGPTTPHAERTVDGAPPIAACTIVSNNYLAYARVFAESYREHHPGARIFVCLVDQPLAEIDYGQLPFEVVFAHELDIPAFENFAFRYDILELNTAVKPYFLTYLRDRVGLSRAIYFDPDILVNARLSGLESALDHHTLLLTPHITAPLDGEERPHERALLMAGVYNLGFLALRLDESTAPLLDWWRERLYRFCLNDLSRGLFVDQSWMAFAPAFLDGVKVLRDPIYNVAYWNLPHRFPVERGGRWEIGGRPVGFFHFSGLDLSQLDAVSRHQSRLSLHSRPELRPLFEQYRDRVLAAGHQRLRSLPYAYDRFSGADIAVSLTLRRLLQRSDPLGRRWPDPFSIQGDDTYLAWLVERLPFAGGHLNRAVLALWEERPDLVRAFPRVHGDDLARYLGWLVDCGEGAASGLHSVFLRGLEAPRARRPVFGYELYPYEAAVVDAGSGVLDSVDLTQPEAMLPWLNEPIPGSLAPSPMVTRLALMLHRMRPDVQRAYPDPLGADQQRYCYWFVHQGSREYRLHPGLVEPVAAGFGLRGRFPRLWRVLPRRARPVAGATKAAPADRPTWAAAAAGPVVTPAPRKAARRDDSAGEMMGVNVAGYFGHDTGVGEVARGSLAALSAAGVAVARVALDGDPWGRVVGGRLHQPEGAPYAVTILHANADETARALGHLPGPSVAGGYKVGCWYWELSHLPLHLAERFELLDEVWAPSQFCADAFAPVATVPVRLVPPCVPAGNVAADRPRFGLSPERFYFLVCFDVASVPERKNPLGAIAAFRELVATTSRDVGLLIKVNRASQNPALLNSLREAAADLPVQILATSASREEMDCLVASADALLSLHRSEGLGLLLIESLYAGRPVVATAYGGVTDFLDATTGYPVPYEVIRLAQDYPPYPRGAVWAEPDTGAAAQAMAAILADPAEAARRTAEGRRRVEAVYGLPAAAERYGLVIREIAEDRRARRSRLDLEEVMV
jgi:glycosyltransferase involved in cell wall biosynthesis